MKIKFKVFLIILLILITYGYSSSDNLGTTSGTGSSLRPQQIEESSIVTDFEVTKTGKTNAIYDIPINRSSTSPLPLSILEGFFIEKCKNGEENHLKLMLVFTDEAEYSPSIFVAKNPDLKLWSIDIYNSHLGGAITEKIKERPIINSLFEEFTLDLNKGISGMKPDIRNVLRFKVTTEVEVNCTVTRDAFNKVVIDLSWFDEEKLMDTHEESNWISKLSFWK